MAVPRRFGIELTGDAQLIAVFATLDLQVQRKCLAPALRNAANEVKKRAVANAPMRKTTIARTMHTAGALRRPKILGGGGKTNLQRLRAMTRIAQHFARLRNSLNVKALKRRRTRVGFSVWTGTRQQLGITSKYYYPAHVEWGHRLSGLASGRVRGRVFGRSRARVKPYPYLGPAFHGHESGILAQLTTDVRARIHTVTGMVVPP